GGGVCAQAIDATLSAGPRHARAHRHPPIVRLPLSSPKREGLPRAPGPPAPHPRAGLLAHGPEMRRRRPDGVFASGSAPPTFPETLSPVATDGGCQAARFLGPIPYTVAGPRRTLPPLPLLARTRTPAPPGARPA